MRANLPTSAVRVEDAPCGCERYEYDSSDAEGIVIPRGGVMCLHTCALGGKNPSPLGDNPPANQKAAPKGKKK